MGYRQRILDNTAKLKNKDHPRHKGVTMQAHHLLSKKGVKNSGLSKDLVHLGYDIDHLNNISLIPSTLPGACHLNIQVHRGDHGSTRADAADDDKQHGPSYHLLVQRWVEQLETEIDKGRYCEKNADKIISAMNIFSKKILKKINNNQVALSSVYKNFGTVNTNRKGCSN